MESGVVGLYHIQWGIRNLWLGLTSNHEGSFSSRYHKQPVTLCVAQTMEINVITKIHAFLMMLYCNNDTIVELYNQVFYSCLLVWHNGSLHQVMYIGKYKPCPSIFLPSNLSFSPAFTLYNISSTRGHHTITSLFPSFYWVPLFLTHSSNRLPQFPSQWIEDFQDWCETELKLYFFNGLILPLHSFPSRLTIVAYFTQSKALKRLHLSTRGSRQI